MGQRRGRALGQQCRQRPGAGALQATAQRVGDGGVGQVHPHPVRDEEVVPPVVPSVVLGDAAAGVVAVPAEPRAGGAVQPRDGPAQPGPVRRPGHALEDEQVAGGGQHRRNRRPGPGQGREPVGLDLRRVGAALDHHRAAVGERPAEHGADEPAGQRRRRRSSGGRCAGQPGTSTRAACPRMAGCASRTRLHRSGGAGHAGTGADPGGKGVESPFVGDSEMARRMREVDWAGTPLGPPAALAAPRCARPSSCCCARSCRCTSRRARGGRCSTTTPTPRCSGRGTRTRWRRRSRTPGPRCGRVCSPCWRTRWPARRSSRRTCRCCWPAAAGRRRRGSPTR